MQGILQLLPAPLHPEQRDLLCPITTLELPIQPSTPPPVMLQKSTKSSTEDFAEKREFLCMTKYQAAALGRLQTHSHPFTMQYGPRRSP